jgi:antitoxin component HigA of HigAB toxin-antitoxin module
MFIQPDHLSYEARRRHFWEQPVERGVFQRADMRAALAERDIAVVYRILQEHGVSQRRIAALTAQSHSEISEILAGRRVVSYDALVRIADGLAVPRGWMGLAYNAEAGGPVHG